MIKSFGECFSEFGFSNAARSGKEERGKRFPWPSEAKVGATKRVDNTGNCVVLPDNLLAQLFFGFIQMLPFVACDKIRINSQSSAKRFDNVSFVVNPGERIGLVGRNGHGKTTLFRMILGEEEPDAGVISVPNYYTIGHLSQHIRFTEDTVLKEGCLSLPV